MHGFVNWSLFGSKSDYSYTAISKYPCMHTYIMTVLLEYIMHLSLIQTIIMQSYNKLTIEKVWALAPPFCPPSKLPLNSVF